MHLKQSPNQTSCWDGVRNYQVVMVRICFFHVDDCLGTELDEDHENWRQRVLLSQQRRQANWNCGRSWGANLFPSNLPVMVLTCHQVVREYYPDHTALDKKGKYYDARHSEESPVWFMVDVKLVSEWDSLLSLEQLKSMKEADCPHKATLQNMMLLKKGSRLSVQPLSEEEWNCIQTLKLEIGNN